MIATPAEIRDEIKDYGHAAVRIVLTAGNPVDAKLFDLGEERVFGKEYSGGEFRLTLADVDHFEWL